MTKTRKKKRSEWPAGCGFCGLHDFAETWGFSPSTLRKYIKKLPKREKELLFWEDPEYRNKGYVQPDILLAHLMVHAKGRRVREQAKRCSRFRYMLTGWLEC